ncbi:MULTISPECIES: hypothetical protein [Rhizobium]|uniref:hypothetical protein n=1 Tax=Rhizobium TaxID=379 RepID=UPI001013D787|nr:MULTISPECIES: hypothetical protein [Rhizobium]TBB11136.1 hypothetical protein ELH50_08560 [Rhizobium ruizarguesonis]MBB4389364.1 hypothetical protein [Rhizobium leguminosarum]MBB5261247.1 hypothetical protein [Rhizobium leguminosarum]MDX6000374.1 hypothetical protein [Rhizobium leguminosarum]NEJ80979.1 hypothetical protein [Rhizobium leguminosarum]
MNFSNSYYFGEEPAIERNNLTAVSGATLSNGVDVRCTPDGLLVFDCTNSDLGSVERLVFQGQGAVPDEVTASNDHVFDIQRRRMTFAVYVAACIYGTHGRNSHSALSGMRYPSLGDMAWITIADGKFISRPEDIDRLRTPGGGDALRKMPIPLATVAQGLELADRLLAHDFNNADPIQLLAMAYQAVVLHAAQHASASLALSAVVVEAASQGTIWASGIVNNTTKTLGAVFPTQFLGSKSRNEVRSMTQQTMASALRDCGVFSGYLYERMENLRNARNKLMHKGNDATQRQSGEALTAMRDVLQILFSEPGFELNAGFTMRF